MNKLNFMGIGPKIGGIALPWLVTSIFLTMRYKETFLFFGDANRILFFTGLGLLIAGAGIYFLTVPALLKGLKETRLITTGTFYLCRNPLYASVVLFIFPGISFMMNSWIVFTTAVVAFILCKILIKSEYAEMEKFFGEEYRKYRAQTPAFFPFPVKKWTRSG